MTTISCTRKLEFDAAHRLREHEGKCKHLHGHRYIVEASFSAPQLDELGRVVDFAIIKEKLGGWIDTNWDHTVILWDKDRELGEAIGNRTGQTIFYLPVNPTAENMAAYLFDQVCPSLFGQSSVRCTQLRLHETSNSFVDVA